MNLARKVIEVEGISCGESFSITTYNILADCHIVGSEQTCYPFVEKDSLLKADGPNSKRHILTVKELNHFNSDIILLQEVEDWYSPYIECEVQKSGYDYNFMSKYGLPEGSALCYKRSRFECIDVVEFIIHHEVERICKTEGVPDDVVSQLKRPNVALIGVLRDLVTDQFIICAGTHVIYDCFERPALQALQASLVCQKIDRMRDELSLLHNNSNISVIFAGDFNGEPDHMSIQLMKNGSLTDSQLKSLETLSYILEGAKAVPVQPTNTSLVTKYLSKYLNNPLKLSSSYFEVLGNEPCVTSAEAFYVGCLDYIFFTPASLEVIAVTEVDSVKDIYALGGPTEQFASDHLPLLAKFKYKDDKIKE